MRRLKARIMDEIAMERTITRLAHEIIERNQGTEHVAIVGIRTRGEFIAQRIVKRIAETEGVAPKLGFLDITLYRDDLHGKLEQPRLKATEILFDINDLNVILVDDVLYSGRTIRAALGALIDIGRPITIQLAVLIDRGHRQLPIRADFVGKNVPTSPQESIRVHMKECDDEDAVLLMNPEAEEGGNR